MNREAAEMEDETKAPEEVQTTEVVPEEPAPFEAPEGAFWDKMKNAPSTKQNAKPYRWVLRDKLTKKILPSKQTALVPSNGPALPKAKTEPECYEQVRIEDLREFMLQPADAPLPENANRMQAMLHALFKIITDSDEVKGRVAAVAAVRELNNRLMGLAPSSAEDRAALTQSKVRVVVITTPDNMMHPEPIAETKREKPVPSFIDAEIVTNKR